MKRLSSIQVIVMAAGQGKRMVSRLPKVLHRLAGRSLLSHVLTTAHSVAPQTTAVVVGHGGAAVREVFAGEVAKAVSFQAHTFFLPLSPCGRGCPEGAGEGEQRLFYPSPPAPLPQGERGEKRGTPSKEGKHFDRNRAKTSDLIFVEQDPPRGTGDAVRVALAALPDAELTLVMNGDCPLITASDVRQLCDVAAQGSLAWLTVKTPSPQGLGRIVRDTNGNVQAIVEERDADEAQKKISEINVGVLAAPTALLKRWVEQLTCDNAQQEYYLTDILAMAVRDGVPVETVQAEDERDTRGVNDRVQLAEVERIVQRKQAEVLMQQGVTFFDPARFDLRGTLRCGSDVSIDVGCVFEGEVTLGNDVEIGAYCVLRNVTLAEGVRVAPFSHLDGAEVGKQAVIGPYARLRPGAKLAEHTHVGNFVEIKASTLGAGSKANHLSYLGDAEIGANVNIGAGTITCNYDGVSKHKTTIGDDAFIGSNTALVAPLTIGQGATIGAGSTLSEDAEAQALTFTRTQPIVKKNWSRPAKKKE
ncbi:MAG: bifunctional UDP-N-acetylglucosamine diphosphorylase/glucosamine-1-phosphate N-acetyltransferase GlmU [Burkholderiales bacterium]|nr:bifunctional UDP-N-acetylglucosamine diphosphorylase/glucosamine-1-phosphate N-acetyltransferase GlmU [Burkholderiales bacterium]